MAEYPAKIECVDIIANLDGEHYNITSPIAAKDRIKALPGAKWNAAARVWQVKKRWHKSIAQMIALYDAEAAEIRHQVQLDAATVSVDLPAFDWITPSRTAPGAWVIRTPYIDGLARRLRSIGGEWIEHEKAWRIPAERSVDLSLAAQGLNEIVAPVIAAQIAAQAARQEAKASRRAAADHEAQERRKYRVLCHEGYNPAVGSTVKWRGEWRVIEGHGATFRADDDLSSLGHPAGLEGMLVRYAYTRAADAAEIAAAEAAEAQANTVAADRAARRQAVDTVARGEAAPDTGAEPEGTTIWADDTSAATGYRVWIVRGQDGWLYHLTYDGSDGGAWGQYNAGYNTRATRVRETAELLDALR